MKNGILKILIVGIFVFFLQVVSVQAAMVGDRVVFNVDEEYAMQGKTQIWATLQYVSANAYFYAENEWWNSLAGDKLIPTRNLAYEFDQIIYPTLRGALGVEWKPGIDGDERITILFVNLKENAGGFFNTHDEYPKTVFSDSNERELIYLNAANYDSPRMRGFLAHEFQHLITFYQKDKLNNISDEVFLNEAKSEYAPTLIGYDASFSGSNLEKRIDDFLKKPSNSLTEWKNQPEDYGSANLFMQYLVEHYGNAILTQMSLNSKTGVDSINEALRTLGFKETFSDIFIDWTIALYLNNCGTGMGQKYCFLNENINNKLLVPPTSVYTLPPVGVSAMMVASMTKDWSPRWYKFTGGNQNLKIDFSGNVNVQFKVPYIIIKSNGEGEIKFFNLNNQQGTVYVSNFGTGISSVVLMPVSQTKMLNFAFEEPYYPFSYAATIVSSIPPVLPTGEPESPSQSSQPTVITPSYPNGSLIRTRGDFKVYVINGKYKRWIQNPYIFNSYGHLKWENIIEATPQERDWYEESFLVRADGDYKVYQVGADGVRHWLNMAASQFVLSGRKWDAIFVINNRERNYYKLGANIVF